MAKIKSLSTDLQSAIADVIGYYKDLASDGMSLADVWALIQRAIATLLRVLELTSSLSRAEKNAAVLEAVGELFDLIAPVVDIPFVPEIVETRLIDPVARKIVLQLAQGAIDATVRVLDRAGWSDAAPGAPPVVTAGEPEPPVIPSVAAQTMIRPY